jgi:SAM-dependent methyltransferase
MPVDIVSKYDRIADGFAERSWANLEFDMGRRFSVATTWGVHLRSGDSVLELGCGDGYLAQLFVENGFRYCGMDISPNMVTVSRKKLLAAGLEAEFMVADVNEISLSKPVDALVSYMGTFFFHVSDPLTVLGRLRPFIRKKIILDMNPRQTDLRSAVNTLRHAGFRNVAWQPFFVPKEKKLSESTLKTLAVCESIRFLRNIPLNWKFPVLLKGETDE